MNPFFIYRKIKPAAKQHISSTAVRLRHEACKVRHHYLTNGNSSSTRYFVEYKFMFEARSKLKGKQVIHFKDYPFYVHKSKYANAFFISVLNRV